MKEKYFKLIELLRLEAKQNNKNKEFLDYLLRVENNFVSEDNIANEANEIRSFLRGANRFADEFVFSDEKRSLIRKEFNELFESISKM